MNPRPRTLLSKAAHNYNDTSLLSIYGETTVLAVRLLMRVWAYKVDHQN
jgi:hypothetical protein